eukprot:6206938-Pleurochrysis_carterae.AAC.4
MSFCTDQTTRGKVHVGFVSGERLGSVSSCTFACFKCCYWTAQLRFFCESIVCQVSMRVKGCVPARTRLCECVPRTCVRACACKCRRQCRTRARGPPAAVRGRACSARPATT